MTRMKNPWEDISLDDYEKHMSLDSVMQLQTMNSIMKDQLDAYDVHTAMILGIAGGNGLEHVNTVKYKKVYGVDINEAYLKTVASRYATMEGGCQIMKYKSSILFLGLCIIAAAALPAAAEKNLSSSQSQIERVVVSYADTGIRDEQALESLAAIDPSLGEQWTQIMDLWETPVSVNDHLPDNLPEDDSLCLVALGFQLNSDGTMKEELIERLKKVLEASQQYPHARIVCTGGGTAADNSTATEAGRMAEWLADKGVDPSRLIIEDQSLTTAQNAIYTFDILESRCPQVEKIAVISSDYHIATGILLFGAEAILRGSTIEIVSNAGWHAPTGTLSAMFQAGALIELSGDVETAFEIYYETYDIHELPSL